MPIPLQPEDARSLGEIIGGALAALFGLRAVQVIASRRKPETTLEDLIEAIEKDGAATRRKLDQLCEEMRSVPTGVALLLDRTDRTREP